VWAQLSSWYKQTVYDPTASLSAERRGTLSLPDVEACYNAKEKYDARVSAHCWAWLCYYIGVMDPRVRSSSRLWPDLQKHNLCFPCVWLLGFNCVIVAVVS
jgi:hypothetical protein